MAEVADLAERRWDTIGDPNKHAAADALRAALRALDDPAKAPEHVIVLFGRTDDDGGCGTRFFQSGSFSYHSQIGLLEEGKMMIRETAS